MKNTGAVNNFFYEILILLFREAINQVWINLTDIKMETGTK